MHLGGSRGPKYFGDFFLFFWWGRTGTWDVPGPLNILWIFYYFFRDRTGTWEVPRAPNIFVEFLVFFFGTVRAPGRSRGRRKSRTGAPAEIYNLSEFLQRKPTLPTSKSDST